MNLSNIFHSPNFPKSIAIGETKALLICKFSCVSQIYNGRVAPALHRTERYM